MNSNKLRFTLAMPLILIIALSAAFSLNGPGSVNVGNTKVSAIGGSFDTFEYTNKYFGIKYTLPEQFAFRNFVAIEADEFSFTDDETGYPYNKSDAFYDYCDSSSYNLSAGTKISTRLFLNDGAMLSAGKITKFFADKAKEVYGAEVSESYSKKIAGKTFTVIDASYNANGLTNSTTLAVCEKNGALFGIVIETNEFDDKDAAEYLSIFEKA